MPKIIVIISISLLINFSGFAQNEDSIDVAVSASTTRTENNEIGLSHNTNSILSFEAFLKCTEITIENKPEAKVISYDLTSFSEDEKSVTPYTGTGNKIPEKLIQDIIASGANRILVENIYLSDGSGRQGFRNFYLK